MAQRFLGILFILVYLLLATFLTLANGNDLAIYGNEPAFANNIVLTIDDVSVEANMRRMFHLLHERGLTATLFPNTRYLQNQDPALWQEMVSVGFEIGYHTRNHTSHMTVEELNSDFESFLMEIRTILNDPTYTIRFVRPPYGDWNQDWTTWAESHNLRSVHWNITSETSDLQYIAGVLQNRNSGGSIVLLHTGYNDVAWLETNLSALLNLNNQYRITNISNALAD